jgi:hypothetical protein
MLEPKKLTPLPPRPRPGDDSVLALLILAAITFAIGVVIAWLAL